MNYDGGMPGGDVPELAQRRLKAMRGELVRRRLKTMRGELRRDQLAVAALVAGLFPSTLKAVSALEELIALPDTPRPAGRRTRHDRQLERLADDVRAWAVGIIEPLTVLAATEVVSDQLESADDDPAPAIRGRSVVEVIVDDPAAREPSGLGNDALYEARDDEMMSYREWAPELDWDRDRSEIAERAMERAKARMKADSPPDFKDIVTWLVRDDPTERVELHFMKNRPDEEGDSASPVWNFGGMPQPDDDELPLRSDAEMPEYVWLCPSDHMEEFYSLHGGTCPSCPRQLVEYRRTGVRRR